MREIANGVFVHAGQQAAISAHNQGDIANVGFIVGGDCVAVIDSGGSLQVGQRLRAAVRAATARPVCYVINTHVHPDHIFGNAAFRADAPVFVGHHRLAAAMAARGANYRNALLRDGGATFAGSEIVPPTLEVKGSRELDLGGRRLVLEAWPTAHTDNDLSIFDPGSGTLWLGDLLFAQHLPVLDGNLVGWLAALDEIGRREPRQVVPGHGAAGDWRTALARQRRYLEALRDETRSALRSGRTLPEAVAGVGLALREDWLLFDTFHRRNVTAAFAELEWEE